jgi:cytochrome c oxidase subunit 4
MTTHTPAQIAHEKRRYIQVFVWLTVLTGMELGVIYMPLSKIAIGGLLILLAGTKAALVAAFYMHLANETRTLTWIAMTPAILCVLLVFALLPDLGALTRAFTKATPQAATTAPPPPH